jgi:hypothetical protein
MRWIAVIAVIALAGCGTSKNESLPAPCANGPGIVEKALAKAPAAVTLDGTPISHCFNIGASGADVQIVGTNLIAAAQELAARHRALQLGYLVGAARRGAKRNGLGDEIVRRLEVETSGIGARRSDYERGLRAGLAQG